MPTAVGPNTFGEENLVFGYDTGDTVNSFPGIPAVNCSGIPSSRGNWSVTEITDGSIVPPRKGARVFKFVAGTASNLYRQGGYYSGGGFTNNNNPNPLILGRTSPDNFTTVSEANKYRYGFWVRGVESNNAGWGFYIDIGDRRSASYTVGNKTDWYFISCVNDLGIASTTHPYDFFDIFTSNQGLTLYIADMGIMRSPGTVDDLPIMQAYPQWVDYGQERTYTEGLKDLTGNSTIDLTNVSFDSNAQMTFDGTDDLISIPMIPLTDFSITQVLNMDNVDNQMPIGGGLYTNGDDYKGYVWFFKGVNQVRVKVDGETGTDFGVNVSTWGGKWISYTATRAGDTYKLYINGQQVDQTRTGSTNQFSVRTIGWGYSNSYAMQGDLAVTKIYNRALTASEIKANYNAIKGRFNI